jgi:hypothetical protein
MDNDVMDSTNKAYLEVRPDAVRELFARAPQGPVVMLNLIRLRAVADYTASPGLAPTEPISGSAAFDRYIAETLPVLRASGGDLMFLASGAGFLIGPADERWDIVMLVRQKDLQTFLAFATNESIVAALAHRTAAVADSRLLPLVERAVSLERDQVMR